VAKYKYVGAEARDVNTGSRLVRVEPGDVVDIDEGLYAQTGEYGEAVLFEPHTTTKKAAKPQKDEA